MDGRAESLEGNRCAQVFSNGSFFPEMHPMASKSQIGETLKTFVLELGVPEELTFDGLKEQTNRNADFIKCCCKNNNSVHRTEPKRPNQNPAENVIREVRRQWCRTMTRKRVPVELWDHQTFTQVGGLRGTCPLEELTGETVGMLEQGRARPQV
jgi:hypothetical protein